MRKLRLMLILSLLSLPFAASANGSTDAQVIYTNPGNEAIDNWYSFTATSGGSYLPNPVSVVSGDISITGGHDPDGCVGTDVNDCSLRIEGTHGILEFDFNNGNQARVIFPPGSSPAPDQNTVCDTPTSSTSAVSSSHSASAAAIDISTAAPSLLSASTEADDPLLANVVTPDLPEDAPEGASSFPDVDTSMSPSLEADNSDWQITDTRVDGTVPDNLGDGVTVGSALCIQPSTLPTNATSGSVTNNDSIVYANTGTSADTEIRPTASGLGIVESLRAPSASGSYTWAVTPAEGSRIEELPDGQIILAGVEDGVADADGTAIGATVTDPNQPSGASGPAAMHDSEIQLDAGDYETYNAATRTPAPVQATFATPWARTATGSSVPATLTWSGSNVSLNVDKSSVSSSAYPVVAGFTVQSLSPQVRSMTAERWPGHINVVPHCTDSAYGYLTHAGGNSYTAHYGGKTKCSTAVHMSGLAALYKPGQLFNSAFEADKHVLTAGFRAEGDLREQTLVGRKAKWPVVWFVITVLDYVTWVKHPDDPICLGYGTNALSCASVAYAE